jgi:hypothetical protein
MMSFSITCTINVMRQHGFCFSLLYVVKQGVEAFMPRNLRDDGWIHALGSQPSYEGVAQAMGVHAHAASKILHAVGRTGALVKARKLNLQRHDDEPVFFIAAFFHLHEQAPLAGLDVLLDGGARLTDTASIIELRKHDCQVTIPVIYSTVKAGAMRLYQQF